MYTVLKIENDTVETLGPRGATFSSFDEADRYAKQLRDRYAHECFVVVQAKTVYRTVQRKSVEQVSADGANVLYAAGALSRRGAGKPAEQGEYLCSDPKVTEVIQFPAH